MNQLHLLQETVNLVDPNTLESGDRSGGHLVPPSYLTGVKFFLENGSPVCLGSGKYGSVFIVEHNGELKALKVFFVPTSLLLFCITVDFGEVETAPTECKENAKKMLSDDVIGSIFTTVKHLKMC